MCFSVSLSSGMLLLQHNYKKQKENASVHDAKRIINVLDGLLFDASRVNDKSSKLLSSKCADVEIQLSKMSALSPVIRSISLSHKNAFYCSSIFGPFAWTEPNPKYVGGRLQLRPGNIVTPNHPFLSLRKVTKNGEVVSTIDSAVLAFVLSTQIDRAITLLNVGDNWLNNNGEFKGKVKIEDGWYHTSLASRKYPLSVHIVLKPSDNFLSFFYKNKISLVSILIFSIVVSLFSWWLLGRPRSPVGEIARALRSQEFIPFFQPIVDATNYDVVGAEVLIRWKHPSVGIINPDLFIPQAEASGFISTMTWQLMQSVAKELQIYRNVLPKH